MSSSSRVIQKRVIEQYGASGFTLYNLELGGEIQLPPTDSREVLSMPENHRVLIIDDDPSHLEIYSKLVQKAGFSAVPVLVRFSGPDNFPDGQIDLVLLDYRLNSVKTAPEIAQEIQVRYRDATIVLLSDLWSPPADVAPFIRQFVRKGEPARLIEVLRTELSAG